MWPSYTFHFSASIPTSKHTKEFNIFSHNVFRDDQQSISALDNVKMTAKHISTKVFFKTTFRKDMFTATLVDLEYETSVYIFDFEMMILLKWYFCLHFSSLYD